LITFDDNEQVSDEETSDRAVISIIESLCEHSLDLVDALNRILNDLDDFPIGIIEVSFRPVFMGNYLFSENA
jgi:hypothetical protein